ncbi:TATA-binding protein-associated factor 172 [Centruroides vittatus]|uniref:TATA-binding protein-associated factor 172 n=1 Tax=Centruroides vittatus TaxID=120091 RepID=UPI00350F4FB7
MTSRLDRLFLLLDTGSSPITRKAAALQLGEVQKLHPHELRNLLAKVRQYLHSSSWDTRIAAGQAVEAIISNVPQWNPVETHIKQEIKNSESASLTGRMKFKEFDIHKVIQNGSDLLASEGKEFDIDFGTGMDQKEILAKQRQLLNKRLGLDISEKFGIDTNEIFSNEDLEIKEIKEENNKKALADVFQMEVLHSPSISTNRDLKGKRKTRFYSKQKSKDFGESQRKSGSLDNDEPSLKKVRHTSKLVEQLSEDSIHLESTLDGQMMLEESKEWPFQSFCDELTQDLFSLSWEIRHGAATALREIVRIHGKGAGKTTDTPSDQVELVNQIWLEDLALRLLCVLALDKFGDYISDQVVAPVRETCAQALGAVLSIMWHSGVEGVLQVILELLKRHEWEARHGGLLGLKYLLAVRQDMTLQLVPAVFDLVCQGLKDPVDDVSAVAAAALVPVTNIIVKTLNDKVPYVISSLWDALLDLDDLTASTSSILLLLSSLLSYPCSSTVSVTHPLAQLVPRLWPFLNHSSSGVRKSVLQALVTLTADVNLQTCQEWLPVVLPDALRLIYQRCLIEHCDDISDILYKVWFQIITCAPFPTLLHAACPYLNVWLCFLMHPSRTAIDSSTNTSWLEVKHKQKEKSQGRGRRLSSSDFIKDSTETHYYIGGNETLTDDHLFREKYVMRARCMAARFLGLLLSHLTKQIPEPAENSEQESLIEGISKILLFHLNSKSALQRIAIGLVLTAWAKHEKDNKCPLSVKKRCLECLNENIYFDEIALAFARLQQECRAFISLLNHHKLSLDSSLQLGNVLTIEQASLLTTTAYQSAISQSKLKPKVIDLLEEKRKVLQKSIAQTSYDQTSLSTTVQASLAGSLITMHYLPEKLNPVIRPLMDSIKRESNEQLQKASATHLVMLLNICVNRNPSPNIKIIKNLIGFLCADSSFTPSVDLQKDKEEKHVSTFASKYSGIITLTNMQKSAEKLIVRRSNSISNKKNTANPDCSYDDPLNLDDDKPNQNELQRRGATFAITEAATYFADELPQKLPSLWETIFSSLKQIIDVESFDGSTFTDKDPLAQDLVISLQLLEIIGPYFHKSLHPELESILPHLCCCLDIPYSAVRHMVARCLGMLSKVITLETLQIVFNKILGKLGATDNDISRQGAVETLYCIINKMNLDIVPYIVLLVVPMLGRMSDQNESVRLTATHCFASLIRLMPLEGGMKDPPDLSPELIQRKAEERRFLEQLMDSKKLENFKVPVRINAELRSYQQDGVNWLAFLNKYKLHGILCDDMGLGKTLQSLCILAGDHYLQEKRYKETKSPDSKPLPSLVICPPTLTGHWVYEVEKFISPQYLNPLHYTGPPAERIRLRNKAKKHNLIIASYDIVRNDIDFFSSFHWNYCILDEGHIIKNGKTKLAKAIKQLSANHRLILTGTPIQNNVLELWSLFDFLMPGFLGTEKQFTACYSKPILQSRDAKSSSKEQEAGVLAMESLHRQVLPFLLRRMKDDVLQDLPPKIIQDYYCELSHLQVQLYEDFAKSQAKKNLENTLEDDSSSNVATSHIFQALQYLRKVCNHPKLVLSNQHPEFERISTQLKEQNSTLSDIHHAAKLCALKQLLLDCGIGTEALNSNTGTELVVSQHRALVFCQLKSMLDILEVDLFKTHMPSVSYLRLDGSIPPGMRHTVVRRFNADPSIDVLLLTTQVGGLGLNLTGADTVIFVEHDWNPMKDLQAMDRAHRIGQKKVVNVYRLVTRGTLEEKIMGLQKFKLTVANTVISQENASLQTMGTDQLLDLFSLDLTKKSDASESSGGHQAKGKGIKAVLDTLPELWGPDQYEKEYDLQNFMQSLRK